MAFVANENFPRHPVSVSSFLPSFLPILKMSFNVRLVRGRLSSVPPRSIAPIHIALSPEVRRAEAPTSPSYDRAETERRA